MLCSDCNKNLAVIFMTKIENGNQKTEGLCFECAKKRGINPLNNMLLQSGMSEEELLHVTEPFYRTDKSRSRAEGGAGLGLALCKNIAEAHGAKLRFESKIGKGTKVFFDFTT